MRKIGVTLVLMIGVTIGWYAWIVPARMLAGIPGVTPSHTTVVEIGVTPEIVTPIREMVTPTPVLVTAIQSLHVRRSPGEHQPIAGYLYTGDSVTLTGKCDRNWAEIEWHGGLGWVNSKFLSGGCVDK